MLERFERYPLTFGPTPIEKLSRPFSNAAAIPGLGTWTMPSARRGRLPS